jgi:CrcB protein
LAATRLGFDFPFATLFVNVVGSFAMGLLVGYFARLGDAPQHLRLFLTTGILGGFTTFSTFSLDTALLFERGEMTTSALYVIASVGLSLLGFFAGIALVRNLG